MKFNCPKPETWEQEKERKAQWHRWFAWYPVRVGEDCRWLEFVEQRAEYVSYYDGGEFQWEFRPASFVGLLP
jgi:hypothetical protein